MLLKNVHRLFISHYRRWFSITAPTSLLATAAIWIAEDRIRGIFGSIPRGEVLFHPWSIAAAGFLRFGSYFLSWLLGCFALAAIATVVLALDDGDNDSAWRHDSHQRAREHFGKLLLAASLTFCAFVAGMALAMLVELAAFRVVGRAPFLRFIYIVSTVGLIAVASIVSWLGAAIPLILKENVGVWTAIKKSVEASSGYEGALLLLVVESVAGPYVAWYVTTYALNLLLPNSVRSSQWSGWLIYFVAIMASAAVEAPLFLGFSLLADREGLEASSVPGAQQTAYIQ